jgi:hypothetical protein
VDIMGQDPGLLVERLWQESLAATRKLAKFSSSARLLAENEPLGELVMLSLCDDECIKSDLWPRLKTIAVWLEKTEELYAAQFGEEFPKRDDRYDLTRKPAGFRNRLEIFKELAEAWESSPLWRAEVAFNDPVTVIKRMKMPLP